MGQTTLLCIRYGEILLFHSNESKCLEPILLCTNCHKDYGELKDFHRHLPECLVDKSLLHATTEWQFKNKKGTEYCNKDTRKNLIVYNVEDFNNVTVKEEVDPDSITIMDMVKLEKELLDPKWFTADNVPEDLIKEEAAPAPSTTSKVRNTRQSTKLLDQQHERVAPKRPASPQNTISTDEPPSKRTPPQRKLIIAQPKANAVSNLPAAPANGTQRKSLRQRSSLGGAATLPNAKDATTKTEHQFVKPKIPPMEQSIKVISFGFDDGECEGAVLPTREAKQKQMAAPQQQLQNRQQQQLHNRQQQQIQNCQQLQQQKLQDQQQRKIAVIQKQMRNQLQQQNGNQLQQRADIQKDRGKPLQMQKQQPSEQPSKQQPLQKQPLQKQPIKPQPSKQQPVPKQQPSKQQPVPNQPVPKQPVQQQPVQKQPIKQQPLKQQTPVPKQTVQQQPVQKQPVQQQPVQQQQQDDTTPNPPKRQETESILKKLHNLGLQVKRTQPPAIVPEPLLNSNDTHTVEILNKLKAKGMQVKVLNRNSSNNNNNNKRVSPSSSNNGNVIINKVTKESIDGKNSHQTSSTATKKTSSKSNFGYTITVKKA